LLWNVRFTSSVCYNILVALPNVAGDFDAFVRNAQT
jgi:hypothetical protein